jgi:hypothetical protein
MLILSSYRDDPYYASKEYDMSDIKVPMLSVANWGGILLHLRGNIEGFVHAGSEFKYLRCITGRHDLPSTTTKRSRFNAASWTPSSRTKTESAGLPRARFLW